MWRIPVGTQIPVEVRNIDRPRSLMKIVDVDLTAGVYNRLPDLGGTDSRGRIWRVHSILIYIGAVGALGDWVDLNLTYEPSDTRLLWERFPITAVNSLRWNALKDGAYGYAQDTITPSETRISPIPDLWLDDDYYWSIFPLGTTGTATILYEEIRV